ncbi:MAG TPA: HNH endonuclease signature motif containing protein [Mycobacterium sp.]|jgi:hypothetical protein|nr:HNH endonuclease signature motif containing protein [Mycobacterium sp.]
MSLSASIDAPVVRPRDRLDALFGELEELAGQRNAIDGRIVEVIAEIDHDRLWGATGARSVAGLVAWKLGLSSATAGTIATVAHRLGEFPRCAANMREGRLSLDQVGVIAAGAGAGSDEHYAQLASVATVNQLRTAIKLEPKPQPEPEADTDGEADADSESESDSESEVESDADGDVEAEVAPEPVELQPSISKTCDEECTRYQIRLSHHDAAKFDAALASHRDALIAEYKRDHGDGEPASATAPPFPNTGAAFMRLVEAGWDAEAARRPHGQHTTVVIHVDIESRIAALHLGPLLPDADRQYLTCDATCEVWFERDGQPIGAGRTTRGISRRLRRALEHRDRTCVVPGCGATRGLHAHHLEHWEDGGQTELDNLVLLCPYHHRLHHRGVITITGPADALVVTDSAGRRLSAGSLARPPTQPPPAVPPWRGPLGERADWWWYDPYQPKPPPTNN